MLFDIGNQIGYSLAFYLLLFILDRRFSQLIFRCYSEKIFGGKGKERIS